MIVNHIYQIENNTIVFPAMHHYTRRQFCRNASRITLGVPAISFIPFYQVMENSFHSEEIGNKNTTAYEYRELYQSHEIYQGHPESPERVRAIHSKLENDALLKKVSRTIPHKDPMPHIKRIHSSAHIKAIDNIPETGDVAKEAVSGVLGAVDMVCNNKFRNAFCNVRPPGHHATNSGRMEGFCYYNNVAVAVKYAQHQYQLGKVLIIDWDYHHGNGTEHFFYDDPGVLFFSTHNRRDYPGTGVPANTGAGEGKGLNINVHCDCGTTDDEMMSAWEEHLIPAVKHFQPEIIFISAGFDSRKDDLLGCFDVTDSGFIRLTQTAMDIARTYSQGRIVSVLEGGYNISGLASAASAHLQTLINYSPSGLL